jgi:hypothetical protein
MRVCRLSIGAPNGCWRWHPVRRLAAHTAFPSRGRPGITADVSSYGCPPSCQRSWSGIFRCAISQVESFDKPPTYGVGGSAMSMPPGIAEQIEDVGQFYARRISLFCHPRARFQAWRASGAYSRIAGWICATALPSKLLLRRFACVVWWVFNRKYSDC